MSTDDVSSPGDAIGEPSHVRGVNDVQLIRTTIGDFFDQVAARYAELEALVVRHQQVRWTWRELQARVTNLAAGLLRLGLEPGDRIGIWSQNNAEWVLTQFATAKSGLILVNINPAYRSIEVQYALNKVQCRALIVSPYFKSSNYLEMLQEPAPELAHCKPGKLASAALPSLSLVIRLGEERTPGMLNFDALLSDARRFDAAQHERESRSPDAALAHVRFGLDLSGRFEPLCEPHLEQNAIAWAGRRVKLRLFDLRQDRALRRIGPTGLE